MLNQKRSFIWVKKTIWVYFILWIFEGALRKWVFPSLSDALLLIRDPLVLFIYAFAIGFGYVPRNLWTLLFNSFSLICFIVGFFLLQELPVIPIYGYRSNFLHISLIFIFPLVIKSADISNIIRFTLIMAPFEAILMVVQFLSPSQSWINVGAGGGAQIESALGHIRPPGTFAYILGAVNFFNVVAAFLIYCLISGERNIAKWLIVLGWVSTIVATIVSGSRIMLISLMLVLTFGVSASVYLKSKFFFKMIPYLCVVSGVVYILSSQSFFSEGSNTLTTRISNANAIEGGVEGVFETRIMGSFADPIARLADAPALGIGLGAGSNVGIKLLGLKQLALGEGEWSRVLSELGPILGSIFILFRFSLFLILIFHAIRKLRIYKDPLAVILLSTVTIDIIVGTFGISSTVGFVVFISGCSLSAAKDPVYISGSSKKYNKSL